MSAVNKYIRSRSHFRPLHRPMGSRAAALCDASSLILPVPYRTVRRQRLDVAVYDLNLQQAPLRREC